MIVLRLALALHLAASAAAAQGADGAVFVVRLGGDTIAVERATITGRRAEGALRLRTQSTLVRQLVELDPSGAATHVVTSAGLGTRGDSALKRLDVTIAGTVRSLG